MKFPDLPRCILAVIMLALASPPIHAEVSGRVTKVAMQKVWVKPGEGNLALADIAEGDLPAEAELRIRVGTPFGELRHEAVSRAAVGENRIVIPPLDMEGGYLVHVDLVIAGESAGSGITVHSVAKSIADDLRYGFYAKYDPAPGGETAYRAKSALLAETYINAVEYYDYFAQHGRYALRDESLSSVQDVTAKLAAGHERNLRGIAYIAAYAADPKVYRDYPFAMTDEKGVARMFSDLQLTTEDKVLEKHGQPTGLYLTAVAEDTPWYSYIMPELRDVVANPRGSSFSFDGFEIDTYGDADGAKFYAKDSKYSGELLSKVLKNFVRDVRDMTHAANPNGLVSFNCVSEFGIEEMYDVTDFLFIELWHWRPEHATYQALVDTCYKHRAPLNQRVVIKIYPTDMKEKQTLFPRLNLKLALGAMMTGAGSLMIAGEPLEESGRLQALSTMIYQQCVPMTPELEDIVKDYYRFDALYYTYTHGRGVNNLDSYIVNLPGYIAKAYDIPKHQTMAVQLLHTGVNHGWGVTAQPTKHLTNQKLTLPLPAGKNIKKITYASPDKPELLTAQSLEYTIQENRLEATLPEIDTHTVVFIHY